MTFVNEPRETLVMWHNTGGIRSRRKIPRIDLSKLANDSYER